MAEGLHPGRVRRYPTAREAWRATAASAGVGAPEL